MFSGPRRVQKQASFENSVIQTLNAWIPHPDDPDRRYFRLEAFEASLDKWEGVPLVFADHHPDLDMFASYPDAALAQVNGKIVGSLSKPRIERGGHPVMMGSISISDPDVLALWEAGELSLSTGFDCMIVGEDVVKVTAPNHILLFREDRSQMPKDRGTRIANMLNGSEIMTKQKPGSNEGEPETTARSFLASLANSIQTLLGSSSSGPDEGGTDPTPAIPAGQTNTPDPATPPADEGETSQEEEDNMVDEMKEKLETAEAGLKAKTTELENMQGQVDALQKELEELKATNAELQKVVDQVNKEQADARFNAVLDTLAPGEKHTEEQKQQLRTLFDEDPYGFMARIPEMMVNQAGTKQEGAQHEALENAGEGEERPGLFD